MAAFVLHSLFTDNMVLQRDRPVTVWGTGDPGADVTVRFRDQQKRTVVDPEGRWELHLDPESAGGPSSLSVRSGEESVELKNVMIGDVWLCSGQSNMQWTCAATDDAAEFLRNADNDPNLRFYLVPKTGAESLLRNVDARWTVCSSETASGFSAVACLFVHSLQSSLKLQDVPIGLIDSSYGGTMVEAWIPEETLQQQFADEELHDSMFGWKPASMFNGMIAPLRPFPLRGVLWYQGESNTTWPQQYPRLFTGLIDSWRKEWNQPDLPFLFVQLPNYAEKCGEYPFTWLREAQAQVARTVSHTGMAVTIDTADGYDLHPKTKQAVGERLARIARARVYGESVPDSGPVYRSHDIEGSAIRVTFDHAKGGLVNANCDGPLRGFALAADDGDFRYADARIDGNSVVLTQQDIPDPVHVRYAWEGNPAADLYNSEGLPAAPFRTDTLPLDPFELYLAPPSRTFTTHAYDIEIDSSGRAARLRVTGIDFLEYSLEAIPGSFFSTFWGPARLLHIRQLGPRILHADIETASIRYEFHDDSMIWILQNRTEEELPFLLVFSPGVEQVTAGDRPAALLPFQGRESNTTWQRGSGALRIEAEGAIQRFPLNETVSRQVWELRLAPREQKTIRIHAMETGPRLTKPTDTALPANIQRP